MALTAATVTAAELPKRFSIPRTAVRLSEWLLDRRGFLPVPIVITEPAVGYGGGVALPFFRHSMREARRSAKAERPYHAPPDIFGVGASRPRTAPRSAAPAACSPSTRIAGAIAAASARPDVNLDFYGVGGSLAAGDRQARLQARRLGLDPAGAAPPRRQQQLRRRCAGSTSTSTASFDAHAARCRAPPQTSSRAQLRASGLSLEHDSRDNIFTPSRGWIGASIPLFYRPRLRQRQ